MDPKYPFEKLEVWQLAVELTGRVYAAARKLPRSEVFALGDQMRRASVSIALNIAEGRAADSEPEFRRFLGIALRSLIEVEACVRLGIQLGLVSQNDADAVCVVADRLEAKLRTLRSRLGSAKAAGRRSAP
jgi:four helix bundle protein